MNANKTYRYMVIVGNIGTVHQSNSLKQASKDYKEYVKQSKAGKGRAAYEDVTLFDEGYPLREHIGTV